MQITAVLSQELLRAPCAFQSHGSADTRSLIGKSWLRKHTRENEKQSYSIPAIATSELYGAIYIYGPRVSHACIQQPRRYSTRPIYIKGLKTRGRPRGKKSAFNYVPLGSFFINLLGRTNIEHTAIEDVGGHRLRFRTSFSLGHDICIAGLRHVVLTKDTNFASLAIKSAGRSARPVNSAASTKPQAQETVRKARLECAAFLQ